MQQEEEQCPAGCSRWLSCPAGCPVPWLSRSQAQVQQEEEQEEEQDEEQAQEREEEHTQEQNFKVPLMLHCRYGLGLPPPTGPPDKASMGSHPRSPECREAP